MSASVKSTLREKLRKQRRELSSQQRQEAAMAIKERVCSMEVYSKARHIAFYMAADGEIDPHYIYQHALKDGRKCYFPVVPQGRSIFQMQFVLSDSQTRLVKNRFGILQPEMTSKTTTIAVTELDLLIIPLVGFDEKCNRLGMGGGFYDRALQILRKDGNDLQSIEHPFLLGIGYHFQLLPEVPVTSLDVPVHSVVTEQGIFN